MVEEKKRVEEVGRLTAVLLDKHQWLFEIAITLDMHFNVQFNFSQIDNGFGRETKKKKLTGC